MSAPCAERRVLQPTPPIKITHPAFCRFLLKAAVSGFAYPSCFPFLVIGGYFKSGGYTMYNTDNNKRFYTPQFSETASVSVRRFAWFLTILYHYSVLPCGTLYYSKYILHKELVNPLLLCITPCYSALLSKIDVIIDNTKVALHLTLVKIIDNCA